MVGIPYVFKGKTLKGMGCYQLVEHYFKSVHKKEITFKGFKEVKYPRRNDVVLFENERLFHCGVMVTNKILLSTDNNVGSSYLVELQRHQNFDKLKKVYRHESFL